MCIPDSLIPLCFPDLRLLVPFSHDISQRGSSDSPLELSCTSGALLGDLLLDTLPVLPTVEHGPVDLSGVALHGV